MCISQQRSGRERTEEGRVLTRRCERKRNKEAEVKASQRSKGKKERKQNIVDIDEGVRLHIKRKEKAGSRRQSRTLPDPLYSGSQKRSENSQGP